MTIDKSINEISEADLIELIADSVMEGKRIEYKQSLEVANDDSKRKFLASIASFANASGGDMIFGMHADSGKPVRLHPLQSFDPDAVKLRIESMMRDGISPKVFGTEFKEVPISGGHALVVRIPKSYSGVHMVTYNKDNRFYARGENGRVLMDVEEIKSGFLLGDTILEKIRKWRLERVFAILADETPKTLDLPSRIVVHIFPLCGFTPLFKANLSGLQHEMKLLAPLYRDYGTVGMDFEGVYCLGEGSNGIDSYTFAFRNGCIETVNTALLKPWGDKKGEIVGSVVESQIIKYIDRMPSLLSRIGVEGPIFIAISYLNVRGFTMWSSPAHYNPSAHGILKDHLLLPELFQENLTNPTQFLRESFYMVWNACGWTQSRSYDENGRWNSKQQ